MNLHEMLLASEMSGKSTESADLSDYYTKSQTDSLLAEKINKVDGMGLSENNFTDDEKTKLSGLENYDDTEIKAQNAMNYFTLGYQRKNKLKIRTAPNTKNGVSFSVDDDGILTLSGTATANADAYFPEYSYSATETDSWIRINEKSIISCYGTLNSLSVSYYKPDSEHIFNNITFKTINNSSHLILEKGAIIIGLYIRMISGADYTGKTLSVMLRNAGITDSTYEPYRPSVEERLTALENAILEGISDD